MRAGRRDVFHDRHRRIDAAHRTVGKRRIVDGVAIDRLGLRAVIKRDLAIGGGFDFGDDIGGDLGLGVRVAASVDERCKADA